MLICIDAGHGFYTPGKRCLKSIDPNETREWVLNSGIADKLQTLLSGYDCQTMRVDDVTGEMDISLKSRCSQANKANADVYVSIHHNAGIHGGSGGGIVVYINPSHQKQSEVMQQAAYRHLIARTGLKGNRSSPLAQANHQVTRETTMPAILCECGFMDSATDTPLILTEEFSQQAAQGLCDALVEVYGLQSVSSEIRPLTTLSAKEFRVEVVSMPKDEIQGDFINAGYFGLYKENGEDFALPAGHLAGDYVATGSTMQHYAKERGAFVGGRWLFDSGKWEYANPNYGKALTTVYTLQGDETNVYVKEMETLPENVLYAVSGIPIIRNGAAVSMEQIRAQGWDASPFRAAWHTVLVVDGGTVSVFPWQSKSDNLVTSGEGAKAFAGHENVIKLDGGGSFFARYRGEEKTSGGSRVICSILRLSTEGDSLTEPSDPGYDKFKIYMSRYRAEQANLMADIWAKGFLDEAVELGLTDGSRPKDFMTREEGALMARAAVMCRK